MGTVRGEHTVHQLAPLVAWHSVSRASRDASVGASRAASTCVQLVVAHRIRLNRRVDRSTAAEQQVTRGRGTGAAGVAAPETGQ